MATKTSLMRWIASATLAAVGLLNAPAFAAAPPPPVPATLTQQGRILDKDGAPVSSKVHFVFNIYDDATASKPANIRWTEEQDITLEDGYFSTELGSVTALDGVFDDGAPLFLGVTVGSDDEMTPRQGITSVPYALVAGVSAVATVAESTPFTGLTGIPAACANGSYLKGFSAAGAAVCGTLPALSCHTVIGTAATAATSAFVGCDTGVPTGGGCSTGDALRVSAFYQCASKFGCLCQIGVPCPSTGDWYCATTAATTITPSIRCCTVQ